MSEITGEKINGKKFRIFPGQSDPLAEHSFYSRTFLPTGTSYDEYDTVDEVVTEIVDNGKFDVPAIPPIGTWIEEGVLYQDDGIVYRVRQSHNVTVYDPDDIPNLFTVYRAETADMLWVVGEQVDKGVKRTYEGTVYECIQPHQTQVDYTPDISITLWKVYVDPGGGYLVWVQPTGAHDAYAIDAIVWYPNENDVLWISKIAANVTVPDGDEPFNRYWEPYTP